MTDPIAQLRAMRNEIAGHMDSARNWIDPSRPVLVGVDAREWVAKLDSVMADIAVERAARMEVAA
jgi:hypothetical protein